MAKRRVTNLLPSLRAPVSLPIATRSPKGNSLPPTTPEIRRGIVYLTAALAWIAVVFGSYFYINFDRVWSKVVELFSALR